LTFAVKSGEDAGLRVVRVTVTGPDGKFVYRLEKNVKTPDGSGTITMPFALNDPVGKYTVDLQEIAAGLTNQVTFTVTSTTRLLPETTLEKYPVPDVPNEQAFRQGTPGAQ